LSFTFLSGKVLPPPPFPSFPRPPSCVNGVFSPPYSFQDPPPSAVPLIFCPANQLGCRAPWLSQQILPCASASILFPPYSLQWASFDFQADWFFLFLSPALRHTRLSTLYDSNLRSFSPAIARSTSKFSRSHRFSTFQPNSSQSIVPFSDWIVRRFLHDSQRSIPSSFLSMHVLFWTSMTPP